MSSGDETELRRGQIEFARDTIKAALLINGAAAIAILTFLGNLEKDGSSTDGIHDLILALSWFGFGVAFAALSFPISLMAQDLLVHREQSQERKRRAENYKFFAFLATMFSIILFLLGVLFCSQAISEHLSGV